MHQKCIICPSHISVQGQVDAIAEDGPPSAPVTTNGSNVAASEGSDATGAPAKVSYQGDSNLQPVVNGLS